LTVPSGLNVEPVGRKLEDRRTARLGWHSYIPDPVFVAVDELALGGQGPAPAEAAAEKAGESEALNSGILADC